MDRVDIAEEDRAAAAVGLLGTTEISSLDMAAKVFIPKPRGTEDSGDVFIVLGVPSSSCNTRRGELKLRLLAGENPPVSTEGED